MNAFRPRSIRSGLSAGASLGRVKRDLGLCVLMAFLAACSERQDASVQGATAASSSRPASAPAAAASAAASDGSGASFGSTSMKGSTAAAEQEGVTRPVTPTAPDFANERKDSQQGASVLAAVVSPLQGQVQEADLRSALDANSPAMERCLREDTVLDVTMKVRPSGELSEVSVTKSQPDVPLARDCVAAVLRKLRVGNVRGGDATVVSLKLKLRKGTL